MSAPVNVLAVIEADAAAANSSRLSDPYTSKATVKACAKESAEARAAIAELIEAARNASATLGHIYHTTPLPAELEQHAHDGYQRLDAAIAAFSPPKAIRHCDHSWATKSVTGGLVKVCERCGLVPPDAALRAVGGAE